MHHPTQNFASTRLAITMTYAFLTLSFLFPLFIQCSIFRPIITQSSKHTIIRPPTRNHSHYNVTVYTPPTLHSFNPHLNRYFSLF
ncbi:hypothetical protein BDQ12DRAFT_675852 [Crucibulum laeve]|uniref:Uncharacterized protein n=1 Tax=Crucibulum laeve TaxID=68775 RepID=A0A5C3MEX1_9AGAR|nr:hypothetical protein BDQ12DRAFT_675852 [Crucibulum laeve]